MIYLVGSHAACETWRAARPGLSPDAVVCVLPGASHGHMLGGDDEVIDAGDATPDQMAALLPCLPAHHRPAPEGLGHRERTPRDPVIVEG
jgi:hypothetical protein